MFASRYKKIGAKIVFLQEIEEHDTGEACRRSWYYTAIFIAY